jgi:long-chain acyl-CoA synthetase
MMSSPDFVPITYRELFERVRGYAGALRERGLQRGDRVAIFSDNCPEWTIADFACQCLGIVSVPIFPSLPADQAQHILADSGSRYCLFGTAELGAKIGDTPGELLREVVPREISAEELRAEASLGQREDLATIIYTSGTTGVPKGVMLPARVILYEIPTIQKAIDVGETDMFFCFLPISHVYERIPGQYLPLLIGGSVAYAKNLASIGSDLVKARPTAMLCVPRFLESFRDRVLDGVKKMPPLRQRLFAMGLEAGIKKAKGQFSPFQPLFDKLVMAKIRERTGGRIRFFVSGGAALSPAVAEFYMAIGIPILQGYGLTETGGGTVVNRPANNRYWTVGEPLDVEVKIAEDGEILIRGDLVMSGYYNMPEETAKVLTPDGWFHTGDIGEFEGKNLKITDRKKDLLVLGNGKNIAPQPIENKMRQSSLIAEAVLLGDGMDHCAALIVPNGARVREQLGLGEDLRLSENDQARKAIKAELDRINKTLAPFEMVKKFALLDQAFSVETGELTPTLKVKRKAVREKYASVIETLL